MHTIGSDPEFFVIKNGAERYPAFNVIKGSKESPTPLGDGYSVLHDNVLIEGNIPPAETLEEFVTNMRTLKVKMNKVLRIFNCKVMESDVEDFDPEHLTDDRAQEFGCMPFTDAWTFEETGAPKILEKFRPAGFHIHVGYENTSEYPKEVVNIAIARAFDYFAVLPAKVYQSDKRREENYGGYGKFRHKPYGLELRSLGGYYAKDEYLKWVYEQTIKAVDFALRTENVTKLLSLETSDLTAIGSANKLGIMTLRNRVDKQSILTEPQKLVT